MSQDTENKQCQICQGYLFEDDDVVVCPQCGAPHHRDCWQTVGHCGAEADHGTDRQYDKRKAEETKAEESQYERVCQSCGRRSNADGGAFCPYCGQPYDSARPHAPHGAGPQVFINGMPFNTDSYGGIPKDSMIEDVKVEHVAKFVGSNAHRYIPRFAVMKPSNRRSWNWAAFLFPSVWNFSRKMYTNGIFYFLVSLAAGLCFVPFNQVVSNLLLNETTQTTANYIGLITENAGAFGWPALVLAAVGLVLWIVPRIICGKTADWTYRGFVLGKVKKIVSDPDVEDIDEELMRSGSLNLVLLFVALLAEQYLPSIIGSLIW